MRFEHCFSKEHESKHDHYLTPITEIIENMSKLILTQLQHVQGESQSQLVTIFREHEPVDATHLQH